MVERADRGAIKTKIMNTKNGFTLIEMIVAVGLFTVVMLAGVGALLSMVDANKKAQTLRTVMDNLNFAVENVTRSMRVGVDYHCGTLGDINTPRDCPTDGDSFIAFHNSNGDLVIFRLTNGSIERSTDDGANYFAITSPQITIDSLVFYVRGAPFVDGLQPRVLMVVKGTAGVKEKTQTTFSLETTISQRLLDA